MKKLFISCPMNGRTDEAIRATREKMHKIAEIVFGEELETIRSFVPMSDEDKGSKNIALKKMAQGILMMAEADYFIYCSGAWDYRGCEIEREIAARYGIESTCVPIDSVAPDVIEIAMRAVPVMEASPQD